MLRSAAAGNSSAAFDNSDTMGKFGNGYARCFGFRRRTGSREVYAGGAEAQRREHSQQIHVDGNSDGGYMVLCPFNVSLVLRYG